MFGFSRAVLQLATILGNRAKDCNIGPDLARVVGQTGQSLTSFRAVPEKLAPALLSSRRPARNWLCPRRLWKALKSHALREIGCDSRIILFIQ